MSGYSFIVYQVNGTSKSIALKKSFDNLDIVDQIDKLRININSAKVTWCNQDVELIPAEVFIPKVSNDTLYKESNGIVTSWKVNPNVLAQLESIFGKNIQHYHLIEYLLGEQNSVKIIQDQKLVYITVTNNIGLESYFVGHFDTAIDIIYYINKLVKLNRKFNYSLIGMDKNLIEIVERHVPVNGILSKSPILTICE